MEKKDELLRVLPIQIRNFLENSNLDYNLLQEIHMRINLPFLIIYENKEFFLTSNGINTNYKNSIIVSNAQIKETLSYISNYSLYAFEDEIKQGFITIEGGHRIGLAGKIIIDEDKIKGMKYISYLNIRFSHQIEGCANKVMPYIRNISRNEIYHTLIISPPRCGKTTLLRDIIRQISNGDDNCNGQSVGVVDERSEIGACYMGHTQNNLGIRTDILDCCPKDKGMIMLIRSMSPRVIAVDEIGLKKDLEAIEYVINCGCKLIATVHGNSLEDIKRKIVLKQMYNEQLIERYIVLTSKNKIGTIEGIYDGEGRSLCLL